MPVDAIIFEWKIRINVYADAIEGERIEQVKEFIFKVPETWKVESDIK